MIQLLGLSFLVYGGLQQNMVSMILGFSFVVLSFAEDIKKIEDDIKNMKIELSFEKRLTKMEEEIKHIKKKGQLDPTTLIIIIIIILLLIWLLQQGYIKLGK